MTPIGNLPLLSGVAASINASKLSAPVQITKPGSQLLGTVMKDLTQTLQKTLGSPAAVALGGLQPFTPPKLPAGGLQATLNEVLIAFQQVSGAAQRLGPGTPGALGKRESPRTPRPGPLTRPWGGVLP